jgi:hypothetical protein
VIKPGEKNGAAGWKAKARPPKSKSLKPSALFHRLCPRNDREHLGPGFNQSWIKSLRPREYSAVKVVQVVSWEKDVWMAAGQPGFGSVSGTEPFLWLEWYW